MGEDDSASAWMNHPVYECMQERTKENPADGHTDLVSVIIPTYNRADLIVEALDSVCRQDYRPIEIIVVDDGSTDSTQQVVESWKLINTAPPNFVVAYYRQENSGAAAARNTGIRKARGEYIQFLDSDDRLHPDRFRHMLEVFEAEQADFIQSGFEGFDAASGEIIARHPGRRDDNPINLALKGLLWANTLRSMLRRSLLETLGPWKEDMSCFEDREYMERAVLHAANPKIVPDILASARRGGGKQLSDSLSTYSGRKNRIYCEQALARSAAEHPLVSRDAMRVFASRLYALGFRCKAKGWNDLAVQCGALAESIAIDLDSQGKRRRAIYRSGRFGAILYGLAARIKAAIKS